MSLPIITADQRLAERRGVKGVLVGKSGIGKTSQLWTLKPTATLFFDLEAGDLAVEGWAGDTIRPRTWQECRDFAVYIGGPNPALREDHPCGARRAWEHTGCCADRIGQDHHAVGCHRQGVGRARCESLHARNLELARPLSPTPSLGLGFVKVQRKGRGQRVQIPLHGAQRNHHSKVAQSGVNGWRINTPGVPGDRTQHRPLPHQRVVYHCSYCARIKRQFMSLVDPSPLLWPDRWNKVSKRHDLSFAGDMLEIMAIATSDFNCDCAPIGCRLLSSCLAGCERRQARTGCRSLDRKRFSRPD